jgi:uncharacterized membrane protein YqhA
MFRRILAGSRYLVIIAVIGSFLASVAVLVYTGVTVISIVFDAFSHGFNVDSAKHLEIEAIEIIDLFLLGAVLYIVALGLYDLFIDDTLPMPPWLVIHTLDNLKERLIAVVVVLLAVTFLGYVVNWNGSINIVGLGVSVGLVLFALGYILRRGLQTPEPADIDKPHAE